MNDDRKQELYAWWCAETNDPETEEWREDLSPEETSLVEQWDEKCRVGFLRLCRAILDGEKRRAQKEAL